jgi:hypothetical protein
MNDTLIDLERYVDEVRSGLADLDAEAREELTEGLVADLTELVAERGIGALPRPEEYADELRAAAGLAPATRRPLLAPDWWRPAWDVAVAALPTWWMARAWVWVMLLHLVLWDSSPDGYDVPWLPTSSWGLGALMWAAAAVVSIQIGRGRLWPGGSARSVAAVVALVLLNAGSVLGAGLAYDTVDTVQDTRAQSWDGNDTNPAVITYQRQQSCSLLVFGADGKRLRGVKVQDRTGRVLAMHNRAC